MYMCVSCIDVPVVLRIVDILSELFRQYGIVLFEFYLSTFHAENVLYVICNSTYIVVHH
jgi:hypothetical protein